MSTPEDQISGKNKTIVFTSQANTSIQYAIGDIVGESYAEVPATIAPDAPIRNTSLKLGLERMPSVSEKINLEDCIKRSNKELSEIKEIEGKKHRVFNFPTDTSLGYIAPNKAVERKILDQASASSNQP